MRFPVKFSTLLAACLFSCIIVLPFLPWSAPEARPYAVEVEITTDRFSYAQIFYDLGTGYSEANSYRQPIPVSEIPRVLRFPMPAGTLRSLRFDPAEGAARIVFRHPRLVGTDGKEIHSFSPSDFVPQQQIKSLKVHGDATEIVTADTANDPILNVTLAKPIELPGRSVPLDHLPGLAVRVFAFLVVLSLAGALLGSKRRQSLACRASATWSWFSAHPWRAIMAGAAVAVILSCYPVLFLGKSFVSPNFSDGTFLLYERFPTLPGYSDAQTEAAQGADVGAIIWQQVPYSAIQSRALREAELPLWNRYNSGGTMLLGQGQTMFGDPLHAIVLLGNGEAWAWDLKYLMAKWLLCCGLGFAVFRCTRHMPSAVITAITGGFLGFFIYRLNHPAFFSFCYSPWILYGWMVIAEAVTVRRLAGGCLLLLAANFTEMHSGTVKEAYMLLLGLNFSGLCALVVAPSPWRAKLMAIGAAIWSGIILLLVTAISWTSFLDALLQSHTSYNTPAAFQILPSVALGFFDEVFYRPLVQEQKVFNPSVNFVVFGGVLYLLAAFRHARAIRHVTPLIWSAVPSAALAFGVVPPQWIIHVPFLGNVHHIDNSFSCVLIILAAVLGGCGWRVAFSRLGTSSGWDDLRRVALLLTLVIVPWLALTHTVHRPIYGANSVSSLLTWGQTLPVSRFVWVSLLVLPSAMFALFWFARRALRSRSLDACGVLMLSLAVAAMLWRHGMHQPEIGPKEFVFTPALRAGFQAPSAAISALIADQPEPARAIGLGGNLFPGWSGTYGIENVAGADAIANSRFLELINAIGLETIWGWRIYVTAANFSAQRPALDFLNVRHYVDLPNDPPVLANGLTPVARADLDVFRSETAWPRAFFSSTVLPYDTPQELAAYVKTAAGRPFAAMLRSDLAAAPNLAVFSASNPAEGQFTRATEYVLKPNSTSFTISASSAGVAVLHESWLPKNFRATVNGTPAPVLRINHAFKGVALPAAGEFRITMTFRPKGYERSLFLTFTGTLLLVVSGIAVWRLRARDFPCTAT